MRLTHEQQQRLVERLNQIWQNPKTCEICHNTSWNISDIVFEMREFHGGGMVLGGDSAIQPMISITCQTCGQTIFMNAIMLGVVEPGQRHPDQHEGGAQ